MNVAALLQRAGVEAGDRPAVWLGQDLWQDYAGLCSRAAALAQSLARSCGLAPGDRVGLAMKNVPQYLEILGGIWHAGLAAVPMNAKLHASDFAYMLEHSGAALCFVSEDLAETLRPLLSDLTLVVVGSTDYEALFSGPPASLVARGADDLAWLFYTSGTTGRPKGAMLTHGNLRAMTACYFADVDAIAAEDCNLHAAPLSHGSGIYVIPHWAAAAAQVIPASGGFDPAEVVELCNVHRGVTGFFAPTMVKRLVDHVVATGARLPGLKTIVYGGGPMYVSDLKRGLQALGPVFVQIYGQGESPMCITALPRRLHRDDGSPEGEALLASVGRAQLLCEVAVADAEGRPLPPGETGEIRVRGPSVMAGYWRNPEATAKAVRDGWLHTGDLGSLDAQGFLTLKDRSKDMIISGGTNIYPREVEEALLTHRGVAECSVVGRPDPDWGEEVVAFVVPSVDGLTAEDLDAHCLATIARFKRPKAYFLVDSLPKNNYGKVLKTELRQRLSETATV